MKSLAYIVAIVMLTAPGVVADAGPPPEVERLRREVDELQRTVAALKAQNATLRTQWGQATLEINRLRAQLAGQGGLSSLPADEQAGDQVERLRRENEDLRSQAAQLTQLAGLAPRDERVGSQAGRITATYDAEADRTTVRTEQERLEVTAGSRARHFLSLAYSYDGQAMTSPPAEVTLFIQAVYSGGIYGSEQPLELTIDGQAVTVRAADYHVNRRSSRIAGRSQVSRDDETVTFLVDADLLRRLSRAVAVTGRLGGVSFELTRDQMALFTAVKQRIESGL